LPENDNIELQIRLDAFAEKLSKVNDAAKSKNKEWWYIAHIYSGRCSPGEICRYPHNSELKATVNLALAYGAKGIGYYRYCSWIDPDSGLMQGGIVDTIGTPVQTYPYNDYYAGTTEYLFDAVKDINQKLDTLGPILQKLEWQWAGPGDSVRYAPGSFLDSIVGRDCEECCSNSICKYPTLPNHIQVGMFKDTSSLGDDYFMLVNRWVGSTALPCEMVTLARGYYSYLYNCLTGAFMDTLAPDGSFHVILPPGEGKLYRLANFLKSNLGGSVIRTNPQKIYLSWTDPNRNETSYRVERKSASGIQ
jgi:hypothetical protein